MSRTFRRGRQTEIPDLVSQVGALLPEGAASVPVLDTEVTDITDQDRYAIRALYERTAEEDKEQIAQFGMGTKPYAVASGVTNIL
ncbi:MAG: hypothetical protein ACE5ED_06385 [Rhodothalassiaceae bacterium]